MQSSSRNGARVRLLAVHTTEGIMRASDLIAFFNKPAAAGSSHAGADNTGALLGPESGYVPYDRSAWTLRNGNPVSDNLEYCGWARYTRQQWLTSEAKGLEAIARWLADRAKARGIPLVKLSPADVKAGKSGVIGHNDWTVGMSDGSHWDPGPGFPWDVVIARAQQIAGGIPAAPAVQEDDMYEDTDRKDAQATKVGVTWALVPENGFNSQGEVTKRIRDIHAQVAGLNGALTALAKLVAEQNGLSLDDVRQVVSEEIARGVDIDVTVNGTAA